MIIDFARIIPSVIINSLKKKKKLLCVDMIGFAAEIPQLPLLCEAGELFEA